MLDAISYSFPRSNDCTHSHEANVNMPRYVRTGLELADSVLVRGRDKMAAILQTAFSNAFSVKKMHEFRLRFQSSLFLKVQLTIFQHWCRLWLGVDQATSHFLNQSITWWSHQVETLSAFLALCGGNPLVTGEFPSLDLCLNKRFSKQSECRWFKTPSRSLRRHCNNLSKCRHRSLSPKWQR